MSEYEYLNVADVYIPVKDFSSSLRAMMAIKQLTSYELGKQIGVHESAVRHWYAGSRFPRKENLTKLCEVLEIDENVVKMLIEREKNKEEK